MFKVKKIVSGFAAACLCASLACAPLLAGCSVQVNVNSSSSTSGNASPAQVDIASLKDRAEQRQLNNVIYEADQATWKSFAAKSVSHIIGFGSAQSIDGTELSDEALENACFSPASLFFALSLLAEGADGDAQQQLLELLGATDPDELAVFCTEWMDLLTEDEEGEETEIANSVWANEGFSFTDYYLELIKESLDATADTVEFGTADADQKIAAWISSATEGLLNPQMQTNAEDVAMLVNALYFKDAWMDAFKPENTADDVFHATTSDVTVPFMHQSLQSGMFAEGEGFTASQLVFSGGASMTFILPDEGATAVDLISDTDAIEKILDLEFDPATVNWSLPKFTIDSTFDQLVGNLMSLGVTDVFQPGNPGMFATMLKSGDTAGFFVSDAIQETHIALDENGVEAAAYTAIAMKMSAMAPTGEPIDFVLDRPFIYVLKSAEDVPLFIGVVVNPSE